MSVKTTQRNDTMTTYRLMSQSRAIDKSLFERFLREYEKTCRRRDVFDSGNRILYRGNDIDDTVIVNFNRRYFHEQIYQALESDPLSTLYSIAWTLCMTCFSTLNDDKKSQTTRDSEYIKTWFPFILLHRMLVRCAKIIDEISPRSNGTTNSREQTVHGNNNDARDESGSASETRHRDSSPYYDVLFTTDELRVADDRYYESYSELINATTSEERSSIYERDCDAYLNSRLFERLMTNTPYGLYESFRKGKLASSNSGERRSDDEIWLRYVNRVNDVRDKRRFVHAFKRYQSHETLRSNVERILRERWSILRRENTHHDKRNNVPIVRLNSWLFGMSCYNEEIFFDAPTASSTRDGKYALLWVMQKSSLVWFLLHSMFALNEIMDGAMTEDVVWFVANGLERFIDCGMCKAHWQTKGQPRWRDVERKIERSGDTSIGAAAANSGFRRGVDETGGGGGGNVNVTSLPILATWNALVRDIDLLLLQTHNDVHTDIDTSLCLTQAALYALRKDYVNLALLIAFCVSGCENPRSKLRRTRSYQIKDTTTRGSISTKIKDQTTTTTTTTTTNTLRMSENNDEIKTNNYDRAISSDDFYKSSSSVRDNALSRFDSGGNTGTAEASGRVVAVTTRYRDARNLDAGNDGAAVAIERNESSVGSGDRRTSANCEEKKGLKYFSSQSNTRIDDIDSSEVVGSSDIPVRATIDVKEEGNDDYCADASHVGDNIVKNLINRNDDSVVDDDSGFDVVNSGDDIAKSHVASRVSGDGSGSGSSDDCIGGGGFVDVVSGGGSSSSSSSSNGSGGGGGSGRVGCSSHIADFAVIERQSLRDFLHSCKVFASETKRRDTCTRPMEIWLSELLSPSSTSSLSVASSSSSSLSSYFAPPLAARSSSAAAALPMDNCESPSNGIACANTYVEGEKFKNSLLFVQRRIALSRLS